VDDASHPIHKPRGINLLHPQGGSLLRTSWCTPDFVAGMSQVAPLEQNEWTAICGQNRWNGIIFAGHPSARIFTQPLQPRKGSVYNAEWGVQHKGVMILQRLRASNAKGQMVWFDSALKRAEKGEWVFAEAPQAYVAVRIARDGGEWKADWVGQRRGGKGRTDIKISERNGRAVAALSVEEGDDIVVITRGGQLVRTNADSIRETGRAAMGVRVVRLNADDTVVAAARVIEREDAESATEVSEEAPPES